MNTAIEYERYHRQLILPGFGEQRQAWLLAAKVLVIGAGGLGCPVLSSLAGAGVGHIGIVDDGLVELSNLQRQFLYTTADIGQPKVNCAQRMLLAANPGITVTCYQLRLTNANALPLLKTYDLVVDATDNFESRYMLADGCALLGKPLVYGAVSRYDGQVALFYRHAVYRDLFPLPPQPGEVPNCNEAGVLGFLPAMIGQLMAGECIKFLTGQGRTLDGRLLGYASLENRFYEVEITPALEARKTAPSTAAAFEAWDYALLCGTKVSGVAEIDVTELRQRYITEKPVLVDVRQPHELPRLDRLIDRQIPLAELLEEMPLVGHGMVVFVCQTGQRSQRAAEIYQAAFPNLRVYSLRGGMAALAQQEWAK